MAMVHRKKRTLEFGGRPTSDAGPGTYEPNDCLIKNRSHQAIITKAPTHGKDKSMATPGPGCYSITQPLHKTEKIVLCDEKEGLIVIERQKNQAVFKSTTPKPAEWRKGSDEPGPGHYNFSDQWEKRAQESHKKAPEEKECVLQAIFSSSNYRPTESIPHKQSQNKNFFVEEEGQAKEANERIIHSSSLERRSNELRSVKPGTSFAKARGSRLQLPCKAEGLGPGSYFQQATIPTKMLSRMAEEPRGGFLQLLDKHEATAREQKPEQHSFTQDSEDASIQYVKEACPGPGSYDISASLGSRRNFSHGSIQQFGITSKRFHPPKPVVDRLSAAHSSDKQQTTKRHNIAVAFGRKQQLFVSMPHSPTASLGPGSYSETRTLHKQLVDTIKRSYQGRFGSNVDRFQGYSKPVEAPAFYDTNTGCMNKGAKVQSPVFRSTSPRSYLEANKENERAVDFYSQKHKTFETQLEQLKKEADEAIVRKPGFNTSTVRFMRMEKERHVVEGQAPGLANLTSPAAKKPAGFTIAASEASPPCPLRENPGPGQYEFLDRWNSKTFNILYI